MIPTLKESYELELKQRLEEYRKNPDLLFEAIDQKEMDEMKAALKKLTDLFELPEFHGLENFRMGLRKAWTNMTDLMNTNKVMRWLKWGSELKDIATYTTGLTSLLKQLPDLAEAMKQSIDPSDKEWNNDEPIAHLLAHDEGALDKLQSLIIKSMRPPSIFGRAKLPYINMDEAAFELLGLSPKEINKLHTLSSKGRSLQRIMSGNFADHFVNMTRALTQGTLGGSGGSGGSTSSSTTTSGQHLVMPGQPQQTGDEEPWERPASPIDPRSFADEFSYKIRDALKYARENYRADSPEAMKYVGSELSGWALDYLMGHGFLNGPIPPDLGEIMAKRAQKPVKDQIKAKYKK